VHGRVAKPVIDGYWDWRLSQTRLGVRPVRRDELPRVVLSVVGIVA